MEQYKGEPIFEKLLNEITDGAKELFSKACDGGCKNYLILSKR